MNIEDYPSGACITSVDHIPFAKHLGFKLLKCADGASEIEFDPLAEHLNSFEVIHGGACMTLLDIAMTMATRSLEVNSGAVTIDMSCSFMLSAKGPVTAHGKVLHRSSSMAFVEGVLLDRQHRLCTKSSGTFKYVKLPS